MLMISAHADPAATSRAVSLTWNNADKVRVWEGFGKQNEVLQATGFSFTIPAGQESYGKPFWIEGIEPSDSLGDTSFTLTHYGQIGGEDVSARDRARGTTWDAKVAKVDFHSQVTKDGQGVPNGREDNLVKLYHKSSIGGGWGVGSEITGAEWERDSDGDGLPDRDEPACYVRHGYVAQTRDDADPKESFLAVELTVETEPPGVELYAFGALQMLAEGAPPMGIPMMMSLETVSMTDPGASPYKIDLESVNPLPSYIVKCSSTFTWSLGIDPAPAAVRPCEETTSHVLYTVLAPVSPTIRNVWPTGEVVDAWNNKVTPQRLDFVLSICRTQGGTDAADIARTIAQQIARLIPRTEMYLEDDGVPWEYWGAAAGGVIDPFVLEEPQGDEARMLSCHQQALLAVCAVGQLGIEAYPHIVYATVDPVPACDSGFSLGGTPLPNPGPNDYVGGYEDSEFFHKFCYGTACEHGVGYAHWLKFPMNNFEGCFRVPVPGVADSDGDGNVWFTTAGFAEHNTSRELLRWYDGQLPQQWEEFPPEDDVEPRVVEGPVPVPPDWNSETEIGTLRLLPDLLLRLAQ